jgi:hypothetical protein
VAGTDAMDGAKVDVTTMGRETTTSQQQESHQQNQPHGQATFPLPQTTIKEAATRAATNPIRTRGTTIGGTVTHVDMTSIMRAQGSRTKGRTIRWDVPGRMWMRTKLRGIVHLVRGNTKLSCLETMQGADKVG